MYRDNNKDLTPGLKASKTGKADGVLRSMARPGSRNNYVCHGAGDVGSVNGKTPRPGYKQKAPQGGGTGSIARPGHAQKIK